MINIRRNAKFLLLFIPETVVIIPIILISVFLPNFCSSVGSFLASNIEIKLAFIAVPVALVVFSWKLTDRLLNPSDNLNKIFYMWQDYYLLKLIAIISTSICGLCLLVAACGLILLATPYYIGIFYLISLSISTTVICTQGLAIQSIKELLVKNT
jgi:hypothetical protein